MFQSFTGNARRPRQVNLSGRTTNPFAAFPGGPAARQTPHASNPQSAVAIAQQERLARQRERERQSASRVIQRTWRGYQSRMKTRDEWRTEWDTTERRRTSTMDVADSEGDHPMYLSRRPTPYATAEECLSQLRLLVQFVGAGQKTDDVLRLIYFSGAFEQTFHSLPTIATEGEWTELLKRLARAMLYVLSSAADNPTCRVGVTPLLRTVVFLAGLIPKKMATIASYYFHAMASLTVNIHVLSAQTGLTHEDMLEGVLAMLRPITSETMTAYESFATSYLTVPNLESFLGRLDGLASQINYKMLASAVGTRLADEKPSSLNSNDIENRLWLLAYLIFFHRYALGSQANHRAPELEFVSVVSELLTSTATYISRRMEMEEASDSEVASSEDYLDPFIKEQLSGLINQESVTGLLSRIRSSQLSEIDLAISDSEASNEARVLATYALTLLRVFPRRGDDIRMWLYLGSAPSGDQISGQPGAKIPAIKYFWQASRSSRIFQTISKDSTKVLPLLKLAEDTNALGSVDNLRKEREQEWTIILLFLELYTFVLKVMDDDEFFSSASSFTASSNAHSSWTRESALPLKDVKEMTLFLKNLGFTLYWNSADLSEREPVEQSAGDLRSYFSSSMHSSGVTTKADEVEAKALVSNLRGVTDIPLDYFKGLVTGLLRMIHERDSRRKFLPPNHWLMTDRFDMEGFIPAVVAEEEKRHEFQDDEDDDGDLMDDGLTELHGLAGTSHAQQAIRNEALRRRQQRAARGKVLATIAPRLEILRNMPFFIPFATRVQIFRQFIFRDQLRRRQGYVDPDAWRMSVAQATMGQMLNNQPAANDILARHHADIRRESLFEDAFSQFYELGDGLKEPIQISFIDRFGTMEAGIDGGGVTKEFLTSVTNEAFKTETELPMFSENDHHLLYPKPTAVEQCRAQLRAAGLSETSAEYSAGIRGLLRRYEFLGRVIGKCLYEGILVDVNFAPFFLLKWALTGGTGSAVKESSYRANLNDLKDLDEGLYQGLLQLKNYPGDVEDFALDFTVTDTIPIPGASNRTVTKDLISQGSTTAVTNKNRLVYISYIARYRLQLQPALQTNAFLQGLGQIIQPAWISMFNQAELQTLVSGETGDIDVEDLRRNTLYGGVYTVGDDLQEHPTIQLFWEVMHQMSNEERQQVLRFVTSTPRGPLLGFSHLNPRFSIRDSSEDQERLPSTSTCVNLLKLPRYSNAETLRTKLLYAVSSGAGFDLS
ncbi:hypothetical protein N7510_010811 [Penicillium lagena]|uniref:uncharacterized protein n=1 Tax=Penicillium lagena TaxID=94218 RepID=UPI00254105AD|nr:uncharacterized protein N7510_010811 [Penicillium lagena]KAJ5601277.1 hypothetical protein N7510_010811 [Penicillium lagena]